MAQTKISTNDTVNRLIAGMPLVRVPVSKHPEILMPLSMAKNEAIIAGNQQLVKKIQLIMRSLKLTPSAPTQNRSIEPQEQQNLQPKEDPNTIVEELMKGRGTDTVNGRNAKKCVSILKERRNAFLEEGNYHSSQIAEDLIQELNSISVEHSYEKSILSKQSRLQSQLLQSTSDFETSKQFWKDKEDDLEREYEESKNELELALIEELEQFEESFPDILPPNFRKVSRSVLQLREQEKMLIRSHRFDEAIPFREKADAIESEELKDQNVKFQQSFDRQRQALQQNQQHQVECFERYWERKRFALQQTRDKELASLKQLVSNLQHRIQTSKSIEQVSVVRKSPMRSPASVHPQIRRVAATHVGTRRLQKKTY